MRAASVRRRGLISAMLNRRSIRYFSNAPVGEEVAKLIIEAGQRAPCVYQSYSVIRLNDPQTRRKVIELVGDDPPLRAPLILLVCLDVRRTSRTFSLLTEKHVLRTERHPVETVEMLIETAMFMENMVIAAEALALGSVVLDYPLRAPEEFSRALSLPEKVIPLFLLCVGQPAESPPLRPRVPLEFVYHVDRYRDPTEEELQSYLREADEAHNSEGYLRKYGNSDAKYGEHLVQKVSQSKSHEEEASDVQRFFRSSGLII
ncbi:MAG: nitroreductase family protein [Thaumarchaeota archaeon]|nr:nitroreductase family protein [Candidatus Calditenuaceae archaeon]MDW8186905.1 nitroreductase family protein [Nitrososphaerota archaeon]